MTQVPKIVDDYYAHINSESIGGLQESNISGDKKKIKLKTKKPSDPVNVLPENREEESFNVVEKKKTIKAKKSSVSIEENKEEKTIIIEELQKVQSSIHDEEKPEKQYSFKRQDIHETSVKISAPTGSKQKGSTPVQPEERTSVFSFSFPVQQKEPVKSVPTYGKAKKTGGKDGTSFDGPEKERVGKRVKGSPYVEKKKKPLDLIDEGETGFIRSTKIHKKKEEKNVEDIKQVLTSRAGEAVIIPDVLSLKELSEKIGVTLPKLIAEFMKNGMMVNINSKIDFDSASIIAEAFEITLEKDNSEGISVQDLFEGNIQDLLKEHDVSNLKPRPPVVSIMGHVDHGKTSLLDYIRSAKVASGEAGGITQSIGAYQVEEKNRKITFLDTPGHEAFTVMRARGAKSTDIAILVVAADEGVKPQTIESINHAKEAGIPIIVAINKMDKEGANPDHVKSQLSDHGLVPEDWGGDIPMIPVSAKTGFGIDELLEIIILVAEMKDLKANPLRAGIATVIESHLDTKLGPVATMLMNTGILSLGDNIVCKDAYGKIKILKDYTNKNVKQALPGDPVLVIGLDKVVEGGDVMQVLPSIEQARARSIEYKDIIANIKAKSMSSLDSIMLKIKAGHLKQLKLLVKADTNGSLEAIKGSLLKLSTAETTVTIIHSGVGNITESDIIMCQGSSAILIGFRVTTVASAKNFIADLGVEFISSDVIYHITEKIEKIVTGMLDPKEVEIALGKASVGGIFYTSKEFMILGLKLKEGVTVEKKCKVRIIKNERLLGYGEVVSVREGIEEVNRFEGPGECGIKYKGTYVPLMGDVLEFYKIEIQK